MDTGRTRTRQRLVNRIEALFEEADEREEKLVDYLYLREEFVSPLVSARLRFLTLSFLIPSLDVMRLATVP
jgi:hypothetical protein